MLKNPERNFVILLVLLTIVAGCDLPEFWASSVPSPQVVTTAVQTKDSENIGGQLRAVSSEVVCNSDLAGDFMSKGERTYDLP